MQISVRRANSAKVPSGLNSGRIEPEASAMIQQGAIEVFTAMVNSGRVLPARAASGVSQRHECSARGDAMKTCATCNASHKNTVDRVLRCMGCVARASGNSNWRPLVPNK